MVIENLRSFCSNFQQKFIKSHLGLAHSLDIDVIGENVSGNFVVGVVRHAIDLGERKIRSFTSAVFMCVNSGITYRHLNRGIFRLGFGRSLGPSRLGTHQTG